MTPTPHIPLLTSDHSQSPDNPFLNAIQSVGNPRQIAIKFFALLALLAFGGVVGAYGVRFGEHAILLLAAPLIIPLGVLLFIQPRLLFYLLIASRCALDPILESARFSSSFGLGALLNLLLIACAGVLCIQRTKASIQQSIVLWVAPLLVMMLGVSYAPELIPALKRLVAFVSYFAVFTIGFILASEEQLKRLLKVIVLSSLVPLGVGFYQITTGGMASTGRLAATFTHPNIYAFYCLLVVITLVYLQRMHARTQVPTGTAQSMGPTIAMWLLLPCLLLSIVMTQTRSAWAALILLGLVYGILFSKRTLFGMLAVLVLAALLPAVQERIMDLFSGNEVVQYAKLNSFAWRQYIWESGLNWMSPSRYLLGYGIGGFFYHSVDFFPLSGGNYFGAHNVFVERLFDGGLVAIAVFSIFFAVQFHHARKLLKQDQFTGLVYFCLMLSYLVLNFSDNVIDYLAYNWYYWVVAGAMYAHARQIPPANTNP
ncbi:O-antigen ligase [Limnobacter thiooxidans]|uniref:O-antigen ligase-related domain-containing protein n=1 Tax=Limnobacter thiooxidans TaxID=131080 RepID=A0AA86MJA5_9BURK|nr:O-antigen ligase [Limnobacter thiooxidans]BET27252.1 hypothetical protein RGQ30_27530 [Limnobacter thiooxidans]